MKRTILALAIAGLSVAAYASPPPGGGPPTPIDVNVVSSVPVTVGNTSVPVTVQNDSIPVNVMPSWTTRAMMRNTGGGPTYIAPSSNNSLSATPLFPGTPRLLTGLTLQIFSRGAPGAGQLCFARVHLGSWDGIDYVAEEEIGLIATTSGGEASIFVPLPNVYVEDGAYLVLKATNGTTEGCWVNAYAHGVAVPN